MAIEKTSFKVSRLDSDFSPHSMSSEEEEILRHGSNIESDDDDCDSGAGSDDFDLLELGEIGEEFCQVDDQTCSVPFELYDISNLGEILSMDAWNECLTEEERFSLTKYLPDMDQEMFMKTLKQLFSGSSLHFGSPLVKLFDMLKGGLCEPRVSLYKQGLMSFQKRQHCHFLRNYHNKMIVNLHQIRDSWVSCKGYSIEEKLQVLNIAKSQKSLMNENMEELESDASERNESRGSFWNKKKNLNFLPQGKTMALRQEKFVKLNPKGKLKEEVGRPFLSNHNGLQMMLGPSSSSFGAISHKNKLSGSGIGEKVEDDEETNYAVFRKGHNISQASVFDKAGFSRFGKNIEGLRNNEYNTDYFMGYPASSVNDIHTYMGNRNVDKLSDISVLTSKPSKTRISSDNGKKFKYFPVEEQMKYGKIQARTSAMKGNQYEYFNEFNPLWRNKAHSEVFSADISPDYGDRNIGSKNWMIGRDSSDYKYVDRLYFPEYGRKISHEKIRANSTQNGGHIGKYTKCEETESDSSEPIDDDEDDNPLMRSKLAYPHEALNGSFLKSGVNSKMAKISQKGKKSSARALDELSQFPRKTSFLHNSGYKLSEDSLFSGKNHLHGAYDNNFYVPPRKSLPTGRKQEEEFLEDTEIIGNLGNKGKGLDTYGDGFREINNAPSYPKWKVSQIPPLFDERDATTSSKKRGKRKIEDNIFIPETVNLKPSVTETVDVEEQEIKLQKKPFTPITPTVHSGFSFSIVHLLSAVRIALVTLLAEDSLEITENNGVEINKLDPSTNSKIPSLTVQEIVNRVRSNPGDPCILETQEPLQDLIRGVLKIFSSKTAPLGAKGWKPIASYEKSKKSWSWTGPIPKILSENEVTEEVTSPEAWLIPHKMLVKLVDAFANWLKSGQETLQQIGRLPNPPLSLMQFNSDEKERFRDLRAQKSLNTISTSTEDIRDYFRKEEFLRYSIPDRAFNYTAIDGKKTIVAPLRRCGGKPTSKARDHFMLKRDRPPHVTILCLVRDAASRLPGNIGTRADVCTLIRDSQYIVEDVSDAQVNQVVSGALDRLHYERDPCVQFDGERKLWVYLHREREEEDFEDDGTSSTKKWKRQKKEAPEAFETELTKAELLFDEKNAINNLDRDDNVEMVGGSELEAMNQSSGMDWEALGLNATGEDKYLCQENSKSNVFDDETFVRKPPDQFLSTSLS